MVRFVLFTGLLMPFLLYRTKRMPLIVLVVMIASQILSFYSLLKTTGGAPLYRDDHPSFMFRLWEFAKTFPMITVYNPYWNGGVVNFVGTTSGIGSVAMLLLPLWRLVPTASVYTFSIGLVYTIVVPVLAVVSMRITGAVRTAGYCAGILALGVSRHFFLWMLHYGTIGAVFSSCFILPVSACVFRVVRLGKREKWLAAALVVSTLFLLQWPPGAIMACAVAVSLLINLRHWSARKMAFLALCGLVVVVLWLRPFLTIALRGEALMDHVLETPGTDSSRLLSADFVRQGWAYSLAHLNEGHALLLFFGIGGLFAVPYRSIRQWHWPMLIFLALVTGWVGQLKPNLQLGRMAIPLFFSAIPPASIVTARLLSTRERRLAVVRSGLLSLLILSGLNVSRIYANRVPAGPYTILQPRTREFAEWFKSNTSEDARILFAGCCVHCYGRGHIAYLPCLAKREMMACDYYHFPPRTVEYNFPPRAFRESDSKLLEFFDLYNVTHVVTFHDDWKERFRGQSEKYEEIREFDDMDISIFRIRRNSTLFMRGKGTVRADFNNIRVNVENPNEDVVLKYNWSDSLRAPEPVDLYPWDAGDGIRLIGVCPNGKKEFTIRFKSWL